jgi:hypothetical protein
MAKKAAGGKTVQTTVKPKRRLGNAVRLDLSDRDHERLNRVAKKKGLNMAAYSRMAILERLHKDEAEGGAN